jgi:hypothetical protein
MSRRSSRRATTPAFAGLIEGTQNGLRRLVSDNIKTVAAMLDMEKDSSTSVLCEKCAQVMRQQQLSVSSFLASFFSADLLSEQAVLLGKSGKGSAAVLAGRIAAEWAHNKPLDVGSEIETATRQKTEELQGIDLKRKAEAETNVDVKISKKAKTLKQSSL